MQNKQLHDALTNFPLEHLGGPYTFIHRLCRENNWSRPEALRAICEYKRFIYLSQVSPVPVTPPHAVDQVWHLHLLYTRSYWDELCQGILGRPLHHGPTRGGAKEEEKFDNWYEHTLTLYRKEFLADPPATIWPKRFNPESNFRWTDLARNWVVPKPRFSGILPSVFPLLLLNASRLPGLVIFLFLGLFVLLVTWPVDNLKKKKSRGGDGCGASSCSSSDGGCGDSGGGDCGGDGGGCGGGGCGGGCGGGD